MEQWLHDLQLAPKSKTHVRGIMHLVFKCAERWGIIELGKNPVSLVRVKNASKRLKRPRVLDVAEYFELLKHRNGPYRTMVQKPKSAKNMAVRSETRAFIGTRRIGRREMGRWSSKTRCIFRIDDRRKTEERWRKCASVGITISMLNENHEKS